MTQPSFAVLADDLTGASDAAMPFARRGARTTVALDAGATAAGSPDVVCLDLDTRAAPVAIAAARVADTLARLPPPTRLFKKIDSTLRGNIAAEIGALLDGRPDATALVVAAHPAYGRTQRDGIVAVDGTPVADSPFGRDLYTPVRSSDVRDHLPAARVAVLTEATVRAGTAALARAVDAAIAGGARAVAIDATTQGDLATIAALASPEDPYLWVGSAGLLDAIAGTFVATSSVAFEPVRCERPVLFVVGSLSAMTHAQIADFIRSGGVTETIDPRTILIDEGRTRSVAIADRIATALARGADVLVALSSDRGDVEAALAMGRAHGFDVASTGRELRERFVELARRATSEAGAVVLSGADVARSFCLAADVAAMRVVGEAAPGVPVVRASTSGPLLVLKAGGAGSPQTYREIAATLRPDVIVRR